MKKRKHMVVARTTKASMDGITVGDKHIDFHGKSAKIIDDPGLAAEIDKEHGLKGDGEVWVERDDRLENHVNYHEGGIHTYFFGSNQKFRDGWERIFGSKPKETPSGGAEARR